MIPIEEFFKSIIYLVYECKYSKKEWNESAVNKVYLWLDLFQNRFLVEFKQYIKDKDDTYLAYTLKVWNDCIEKMAHQEKSPKILDLDLNGLINGTLNLSEYIFKSWIDNINITENKFKIFFDHHALNLSKIQSGSSDSNNSNSIINSFKEYIANNSFNSILEEYNKNSLNHLQNNIESSSNSIFKYSIELLLYRNDNIKKKAAAQLVLKHFIKLQKEYNSSHNNNNNNNHDNSSTNNSLNPEIIDILNRIFTDQSTMDIFSWIVLAIFEKEVKEHHQLQDQQQQEQFDNVMDQEKSIYRGIIGFIIKSKPPARISYFLNGDKELLLEISKFDQDFNKSYYGSIFYLLDYYLFNSTSRKQISEFYIKSISTSLEQLNQLFGNEIQNQVNQRLLGTNYLEMNTTSKDIVLALLIKFKDSNSSVSISNHKANK